MPRVLSYTPPWLSRGAPGFDVFNQSNLKGKSSHRAANAPTKMGAPGPKRTIANRGNEIFVAVGNEIRWANLLHLKEAGHDKEKRSFGKTWKNGQGRGHLEAMDELDQVYRILRTNVSGQITKLSIAPNNDYMAICTSHTVHIALLPDSAHLVSDDTGPIKLKTFHLGPTSHVLDSSPLAAVLWHPLGRHGRCIVTVTSDANLRLWEFNRDNRNSFGEPELSIDLKKLASGVDSMEDFRAARIDEKNGYTPDSFEMEVASACFGATSKTNSRGWNPMTLWVAMKNGDIYALCPLLPKRWEYPSQGRPFLRSLALPIQARDQISGPEDDEDFDQQTSEQQREWFAGIRGDLDENPRTGELLEVYTRPVHPGPIPRLQGPFILDPEVEVDDSEVTDIIVVNPSNEFDAEDEEDASRDDPPVSIICVATNQGKMHVCLEFEGVEGEWLPMESSSGIVPLYDCPLLQLFETVEFQTQDGNEVSCHPVFTADAKGGASLFVSTETGVYFVGMTGWVRPLYDELSNFEQDGAALRIEAILRGAGSLLESIVHYRQDQYGDKLSPTAACIAIANVELGYFLLASEGSQPHAIVIDAPDSDYYADGHPVVPYEYDEVTGPKLPEPWPAYQPPQSLFDFQSQLPKFMEHVPERHKFLLKEEIRMSTATLDILTKAHRVLVNETQLLGQAASSLFTRCQRLQDELRDQLRKANDVANQIEDITGEEDANQGELTGSKKIDARIEQVKAKQKELVERTERIRQKLSKAGTRELSDKERAWFAEVDRMKAGLLDSSPPDEGEEPTPSRRLSQIRKLKEDLLRQVHELGTEEPAEKKGDDEVKVPSEFRKKKVQQIMELLDRESAMVEAATKKLRRLTVASGGY
ncbi:hypothetical protein IWX49DRAFT_497092 [Phyllosticta citricarpa]|uniref:Nuclear pore complex protein An-Nup82 n=1 Tax=Phyllosticta paracitricarpa TaxID=2016321 RepID=A0ABR1NJE4_9PEZI